MKRKQTKMKRMNDCIALRKTTTLTAPSLKVRLNDPSAFDRILTSYSSKQSFKSLSFTCIHRYMLLTCVLLVSRMPLTTGVALDTKNSESMATFSNSNSSSPSASASTSIITPTVNDASVSYKNLNTVWTDASALHLTKSNFSSPSINWTALYHQSLSSSPSSLSPPSSSSPLLSSSSAAFSSKVNRDNQSSNNNNSSNRFWSSSKSPHKPFTVDQLLSSNAPFSTAESNELLELVAESESSNGEATFGAAYSPTMLTFARILYGVVCIVGLCGNTLVIYVVLRFSKMQTVTNMYILNLALADEMFLVGLPFLIATLTYKYWAFGWLMCKVYMTITSINQFTSSLLLTVMSADRYDILEHFSHLTFKYNQKKPN